MPETNRLAGVTLYVDSEELSFTIDIPPGRNNLIFRTIHLFTATGGTKKDVFGKKSYHTD